MSPPSADVDALFAAPILRGLGEGDRQVVLRSVQFRELAAGDVVFEPESVADSLFVVIRGDVELRGRRRADASASVLRVVRTGESFGEDALLLGGTRRLRASATASASVAEIATSVLSRVVARSGTEATLARELRFAERSVLADLCRTTAFAGELDERDLDLLLDGASRVSLERGARAFSPGDVADAFYLVLEGLIQLQRPRDGSPEICAYLTSGDFFGDEELRTGEPRRLGAVATAPTELLSVPAQLFTTLADRNPRLLGRVRRIQTDREAEQAPALGGAASTQHVLHDVYRMQMARSLLVIDQDTCVRCGHCAWTCESLHGVSRLVRRGDKVVTALKTVDGPRAHSLMLPSSCQHCRNPVCMVDCPTGAIGRDPEGEVFIREELCVGCGNCAKACPWENIHMAPRSAGMSVAVAGRRDEVAVKCDLCREYEAPGCVSACPTQSIFRLEPARDFAEVEALLRPGVEPTRAGASAVKAPSFAVGLALVGGLAVGLSIAACVAHAAGALAPSEGLGLFAGWLALGAITGLALYSGPKRLVRRWLGRRDKRASTPRAPARSRLRPFYRAHLAIGLLSVPAVLAHAGPSISPTAAGALGLAFFLVAGLGALGAWLHRVVPARLTRLERAGTLPEDLAREREALIDRLHLGATGKSELVKGVLERVLLPYASAPLGPLARVLGGRDRDEEEAHLRARIDALLEGRGGARLAGLDELIGVVVELRALPARRWLQRALRAWLLPHIVLTGALVALVVVHLVAVLAR